MSKKKKKSFEKNREENREENRELSRDELQRMSGGAAKPDAEPKSASVKSSWVKSAEEKGHHHRDDGFARELKR
jgi:hypothetical protein